MNGKHKKTSPVSHSSESRAGANEAEAAIGGRRQNNKGRGPGARETAEENVVYRERHTDWIDTSTLTIEQRIRHYERALAELHQPWSHREEVLYNVLQYLLEKTQREQQQTNH